MVTDALAEERGESVTEPWWIALIEAVIIVNVVLVLFAYLTLVERKLMGRMQLRFGPNRAGPYGLLQPIAERYHVPIVITGFEPIDMLEGVLRNWQPSHMAGEQHVLRDSAMFSITDTEWPTVRASLAQRLR